MANPLSNTHQGTGPRGSAHYDFVTTSADDVTNEIDETPSPKPRVRMSGSQRREQLVAVGRKLFAAKGYEAVSVEEIAAKAEVSKPVVYEHFGGKEGLYAVIVDREVTGLIETIMDALSSPSRSRTSPRRLRASLPRNLVRAATPRSLHRCTRKCWLAWSA